MFSSPRMFTALTAAALASTTFSAPTTSLSAAPSSYSTAPSNYSLVADFSGSTFFDGFTTFVGADPTEGNVNYVGMQYGAQNGLLGLIDNKVTNSINAYIGVDYNNVTANRNSIRLSSKQTFDAGTVITFDVVHAPVAYGTWPALWLLGDVPGSDWPSAGGEADILEWVHETPYNSMTLHTAPGCTVDNTTSAFQGQLQNTNCNAGTGSTGCSIQALNQDATKTTPLATAGQAFNDQGGAVYAVDWSAQGLSVYMFARDSLPADLAAGKPDPASWSAAPLAQFSGSGCDFTTSLSTMQIIEDITFCGSWAGKPEVWQSSGAAAATKVDTCAEYVQNNPKAFKDAYFEIASIRVYSDGAQPGIATNAKRDVPAEPISFQTINPSDRHNEGTPTSTIVAHQNGTNGTGDGHHHGHHHVHHGHNSTHHHGNGTSTVTEQPRSTASLPVLSDKKGGRFSSSKGPKVRSGGAVTSGSAPTIDSPLSSIAALIAFVIAGFAV